MVTADRADATRQRVADLIARADSALARPRPAEAAEWRVPAPQPAPPLLRQPQPATYATRAEVERRLAAMEQAIGEFTGRERRAWQMRCASAEARIDALEARLADLEGRRDG